MDEREIRAIEVQGIDCRVLAAVFPDLTPEDLLQVRGVIAGMKLARRFSKSNIAEKSA